MTSHSAIPVQSIGVEPSAYDKFIALFVGSIGILIAGIQPAVLGGLREAGRITIQQMGIAGAIELLAIGIAAGLSSALLPPRRVRIIAALASAVMLATNLLNLDLSGVEIIICRLLAGLAEGVMMWLAIALITRTAHPERWHAIFLTVQTAAQFAVAVIIPSVIAPRFGVNGTLVLMAVTAGFAVVASLLGPREFAELPKRSSVSASTPTLDLSGRSWAALACIFMYMAFIVGVWVYIEPIGIQAGLSHHVASYAVAVSLATQILGGIAAAALGRRLTYFAAFVISSVVNLALLAMLAFVPGSTLFFSVVAVHGFFWIFVMPYHVLLLVDVDPTRRSAMLMTAAQLLGGSAGPYMASMLVSDSEVRGALAVGAVAILLSMAILFALRMSGKGATSTAAVDTA